MGEISLRRFSARQVAMDGVARGCYLIYGISQASLIAISL